MNARIAAKIAPRYEQGDIVQWADEPAEFESYDYPAKRVWIKTTAGRRHPLQREIQPL